MNHKEQGRGRISNTQGLIALAWVFGIGLVVHVLTQGVPW